MLKVFQENIDVLSRGDASEKDHFAFWRQLFRQFASVARERFAVTGIDFVNGPLGKFAQIAQPHFSARIDQAARGSDDENAAKTVRGAGEGIGISEFAAKIQTAEEGE